MTVTQTRCLLSGVHDGPGLKHLVFCATFQPCDSPASGFACLRTCPLICEIRSIVVQIMAVLTRAVLKAKLDKVMYRPQ